jgi:hypothetical protein
MRLFYKYFILSLFGASAVSAQTGTKGVETPVKQYFAQMTLPIRSNRPQVKEVSIDSKRKRISITANSSLAYLPFTPQTVERMYAEIKATLPSPYNKYTLLIYSDGKLIEELVPNALREGKKDRSRMTLDLEYRDEPWVSCTSLPYEVTRGLNNRHIAIWQSHGRFYKNDRSRWEWQRPNVFCTNEDLFTQSFVIPYVIPMMERAGATVYTPRERDSQRNEVIVDNDMKNGSLYSEEKSHKGRWTTSELPGFASPKSQYADGENPFQMGTARVVKAEKREDKAFAEWIPTIPESGEYAVYVSYQTLPESVPDAKYVVCHEGGITEFRVNQRIGGGTWVYLGKFFFKKGRNATGMVILTNHSKEKGVVSADAVRFGGGMGNISRGGSLSGLPRNLEGARYSAQWGGMPYTVYGGKEGENDYTDDINARSNAINYLSGGSIFNPSEEGLGVPFEMSLAVHSDAGYTTDDQQIGTLGIYTTNFNNGKLGAGTDRYASRDLIDLTITQIQNDVQAELKQTWTRRAMWNRNYSETRLPAVPSAIVEMLSHQNFADMRLGHDPNFKFTVGRAIYKAALKFLSHQHGEEYTVQPLPVSHFAIKQKSGNEFELSWSAVDDPQEPTAKAREYVVYTAMGNEVFDNGVAVKHPHHTVTLTPGVVYSFKVTAVNAGGESFPSEILSAYKAPEEKGRVLIVNAFNRLSGPAVVNTEAQAGFDIDADPGVAYQYNQSLCGAQQVMERSQAGKDGEKMLGYSGSELEGMKIAGNTFDYAYTHGMAIKAAGYSFTSCSDEALEEGIINPAEYRLMDIIYGLERDAPQNMKYYKCFTQRMQRAVEAFTAAGGGLMVSGAYIGSDMTATEQQREFTERVLHYSYQGQLTDKSMNEVTGLWQRMTIPRRVNEKSYAVPTADCLYPAEGGFSTLMYSGNSKSAAVAYKGKYRVFAMGFPFESIESAQGRSKLMASILNFLEQGAAK